MRLLGLYLGDYSRRFYLREISKLSGMSLRTAQRTLEALEAAKTVKSECRGKNKYFFPNLENVMTKLALLCAETHITLEFLEKYPAFGPFLREATGVQNAPVIVFGSFAKSNVDKNSDVDIIVLSDKKIELPFHLLPNKIHEIRVSEERFIRSFEKGEALAEKIRESHIILNNHSFFVNLMWDRYAR